MDDLCYNLAPEGALTETTTYSEIAVPASRVDPQRMAWGVLLISFAIFCLICVISGLGAQWFLFQSVVPLTSQLEVGRGTAGITFSADPREQVVRDGYDLSGTKGTTIRTDAQSQAAVSFFDSGFLVATVTLRSNTSINLRDAARPRFEWSTNRYEIVIDDFSGEMDVFVANGLTRDDIRLSIQAPGNRWIILDGGGTYSANASESQVQVVNMHGEAVLVAANSPEGISISAGSQGIISADESHAVATLPYIDLLETAVFPQNSDTNSSTGASPDINDTWICSNGENDSPRGDYGTEVLDGRLALRLIRGDTATESHGETRCIKWFGQGGQNVEDAGYLELQARFRIASQNIGACGVEGSECPLMLRMDYIDMNNVPRRWIHGFYTYSDPQQNWPLRCNSCALDHEFISAGYWYIYETGNLVTLIPQDQRIRSILNVQFYASGHQYDIHMSDVSLLVGQVRSG